MPARRIDEVLLIGERLEFQRAERGDDAGVVSGLPQQLHFVGCR